MFSGRQVGRCAIPLPQVGVEAVIELDKFKPNAKVIIQALEEINKATDKFAKTKLPDLNLSKMGSGLSGLGTQFSGLGKTVLGFGATAASVAANVLATLGKVLAVTLVSGFAAVTAAAGAATAAVTAFVVSGIGKAANLEQQIANIAAVMGKTKDEAQPLKDLINELSLNPNLKVDTTEAATAIELLARNGLDMTQIMDGAALATVQMANATGADFGVAADVATDALVNFNLEIDEMQKAVDGATGVITNSKFDVNDYATAMGQAGGVAGAFGVELEDFNTVLAGTASIFNGGSDAGTSFKTFLQRLVPQSKEAAATMRELGLFTGLTEKEFAQTEEKVAKVDAQIAKLDPTSKNYSKRLEELTSKQNALKSSLVTGQNAFFDTEGNLKSMSEISDVLAEATAGLSEEQKNTYLTTIFQSDAIRTAISLADLGGGKFDELSAKVNKVGQAADASATRMDTFQGAMEILRGIVESVQIQIGDKFLPILTDLAKQAAAFAEKAAPKLIDFFGRLADRFTVFASEAGPKVIKFFQKVGPAIGSVINRVADLVFTYAPLLIDFAARLPSFFKGGLSGEGGIIGSLSRIFGIFAESIPRLEAAFQQGGFAALFGELGEVLRSVFVQVIQPKIIELARMLWGWLAEQLGITPESGTLFSQVITTISDLASGISNILQPVLDELANGGLLERINSAITFVSEKFELFKGAILGIGAVLAGGVFATIGSVLLSLLTPINLIIAGAALLGVAWSENWFGIRDTLTEVWENNLKPAIEQIGEFLKVTIPLALQELSSFWNENWPAISQTLSTAWEKIKGVFDAIVETVSGIWEKLQPSFDNISGAMDNLGLTWGEIGNALLEATKLVFAGIGLVILTATSVVAGFATAIATSITIVTDWFEEASRVATEVFGGIEEILTGFAEVFASIMEGDISGVVEGLQKVWDGLKQTVQGVIDGIINNLTTLRDLGLEPAKAFVEGLTGLFQGVYDALVGNSIVPDLISDIVAEFTKLPDLIVGALGGLSETVKGIFSGIFGEEGVSGFLGGLFGGGEEEGGGGLLGGLFGGGMGGEAGTGMPGEQMGPSQLTQSFNLLATQIMPLVQQQMTLFLTTLTTQLPPIVAFITQINTMMTQLAGEILTLLLSQIQLIIQTIQEGSVVVIETLTVVIETITLVIETVTLLGTTIDEVIAGAVSGLEDMISKTGELDEATKTLIETVNLLATAYQAAATASQGVQSPSSSGGSSRSISRPRRSTGRNFQEGTGGVLEVPGGYGGDSYPVFLSSGEQFAVSPPGQSLGSILAQSLGQAIGGPAQVSGPASIGGGSVTNNNTYNLGGNTFNNQMDDATFEARVTQIIEKKMR